MYPLKLRQSTHVFALVVAFGLIFALYCGNFLDEKISDIIDDIQSLLTPQATYYGNYKSPYFY